LFLCKLVQVVCNSLILTTEDLDLTVADTEFRREFIKLAGKLRFFNEQRRSLGNKLIHLLARSFQEAKQDRLILLAGKLAFSCARKNRMGRVGYLFRHWPRYKRRHRGNEVLRGDR
jgi:hypothetical protein